MIERKRQGRMSGFTLIELLVVVLILAILMSVALPLYLSTQQNAEKRTCRANMQTIANCIQAAKVTNRASNYATWIGATVNSTNEPDLQSTPICPNSGTYSVANGNTGDNTTFKVQCTASGHGTFQPGVDAS